ncbi:hypothetical protein MBUL_01462 [Methylobacterium bullatum]|uniref:Uncharacterized protein n=1 Tax=Methylobacterium bullatum TaxID=570505 RepID=A0A679IT59_9HYPH|nr:hypothetical protein MBUL_01462 [Methylobacterium bullatum]
MRLIFGYLALAQTRLALADLARSQMLDRLATEALQRGEERMRLAHSLAARCGMARR